MTPALERWLREAIQGGRGRPLGSGYQASVRAYTTPAGELVVKQAHGSRLLGAVWRRLLRREHGVYRRLAGIAGIPRCLGLLGDDCLVLEHIAGPSLREYESQLLDRETFFSRLRRTLDAMHAAGVAHGDLKRKDNVIVGPGEQPYLVDFGVAFLRSDRRALLNRVLFDPVRQIDDNAWVKLKYQRRFDALSAEDAPLYRPLLLERIARAIRIPWQKLTLRRPRQRWRAKRRSGRSSDDPGRPPPDSAP